MKIQETLKSQSLKKKKKTRRLTLPISKLTTKNGDQTVWFWHKGIHTNQYNRTGPRTKPLCLWPTDFDKGIKII